MSAVVKLMSKLPADFENNGLDALVEHLIAVPEQIRCALVWYDVDHKNEITDSAKVVPYIRVRKIEPLGDVDEMTEAVKAVWFAAEQQRTGKQPLPFGEAEPEAPAGEAVDA